MFGKSEGKDTYQTGACPNTSANRTNKMKTSSNFGLSPPNIGPISDDKVSPTGSCHTRGPVDPFYYSIHQRRFDEIVKYEDFLPQTAEVSMTPIAMRIPSVGLGDHFNNRRRAVLFCLDVPVYEAQVECRSMVFFPRALKMASCSVRHMITH